MNGFLLKSDYRYNYLIIEAFEQGNTERLKSFIKMERLIPIETNGMMIKQPCDCKST